MLLLTTERAPVSLLPHLPSSRWAPRRPVGTVAADRLVFPPEQECPQDSTVGFANQIKNIPSISNFTNGFGVLTDP